MSTTNEFARVPVPATGMLYDRHPNQVGLEGISECINWLPYDLRLKTRPGTIETGSPFSPVTTSATYEFPTGVYQFDNGTIETALVCETTVDEPNGSGFYGTIRSYSPASETWDVVDATYLTTNAVNPCTILSFETTVSAEYKNWVIFLNGEDDLAYWDGTSTTISTVSSITALTGDVIADRLMVGNLGGYSAKLVKVSDYLDFTTFQTVNDRMFGESDGDVRCVRALGFLQGAVYKDDAIFIALSQGDIYPFQFEPKFRNIPGPVSPAAVETLPNGSHIFVGSDGGIYVFDGSSLQEVNPSANRYLTDHWDLNKAGRIIVRYDARDKHLYIFFPSRGSDFNDMGIALAYPSFSMYPVGFHQWISCAASVRLSEDILIGQLGNIDALPQIGDLTTYNDAMLFGGLFPATTAYGTFWALDHNRAQDPPKDNTEFFEHYLKTGMSDFGDPLSTKIVNEVEVFLNSVRDESGQCDVQLISSRAGTIEEAHTAQTVSFERSAGSYHARQSTGWRVRNRFFALKVGNTMTADKTGVEFGGAAIAFAVGGRR